MIKKGTFLPSAILCTFSTHFFLKEAGHIYQKKALYKKKNPKDLVTSLITFFFFNQEAKWRCIKIGRFHGKGGGEKF